MLNLEEIARAHHPDVNKYRNQVPEMRGYSTPSCFCSGIGLGLEFRLNLVLLGQPYGCLPLILHKQLGHRLHLC